LFISSYLKVFLIISISEKQITSNMISLFLRILLISFFVMPPAWAETPPSVSVETLGASGQSANSDEVKAVFHGQVLSVEILHHKGIGRIRLSLKDLKLKGRGQATVGSIPMKVSFHNFAMLEGFTVGSGAGEIYSLTNSRAKKRKFLLRIPLSSPAATIDLAWVDAYRH
jgi:hypothetical protein